MLARALELSVLDEESFELIETECCLIMDCSDEALDVMVFLIGNAIWVCGKEGV